MIQVKFLGGAKKSFSVDFINLDDDGLILERLLEILQARKPENTPSLDIDNILIAVNGIDSSAMDGRKTIINSGDIVSIIPVIHGGSQTIFDIQKTCVAVFPIPGKKNLDYEFLDSLRTKFPKATIQAIYSKFILGLPHIKKILHVSLESQRRKILLSDRLETDILLRFAATTQISKAISDLGIRPNKDFVIIALAAKPLLDKISMELSGMIDSEILLQKNTSHITRHFKISQHHIDSVSSSTPLEDILVERASVLF